MKKQSRPRKNWKARALKAEAELSNRDGIYIPATPLASQRLNVDPGEFILVKSEASRRLAELAKPEPWLWRLLTWWRR